MDEKISQNKSENSLHSFLLIAGMATLLSLIGWFLFGIWGLGVAIIFTIANAIYGPRVSSKIVLNMYKAKRIGNRDSPQLTRLFDELCRRAELDSKPGLYYIPSRTPNAFATGVGKSSAVAVTDGLIRLLSPRELAGVLAHEVAHLRHCDTRVMGLADSIGRITSFLARIGIFMILFSGASILFTGNGWQTAFTAILMVIAPGSIALMQLALSRSREFNADMGAAEITGDPMGLASALSKLDPESAKSILGRAFDPNQMKQPAFLRSHPPTSERVRELEEVAQKTTDLKPKISSVQERASTNRRGEPVVYIGFPKVRERSRFRATHGIYR